MAYEQSTHPPAYSEKATQDSLTAPPVPQSTTASSGPFFELHSPALSRSIVFSDRSTQRGVLYVETSSWTPGKPDITLHSGGDASGPVLGVSRLHKMRPTEMGLGDPAQAHAVVWEQLSEGGVFSHRRFSFEADVSGQRRTFGWERTRSGDDGVHGFKKVSALNFVLKDMHNGQNLATYLVGSGIGWGKRGTLDFKVQLPQNVEILAVLSMTTIIIKAARRQSGAAGSAGGGGGC